MNNAPGQGTSRKARQRRNRRQQQSQKTNVITIQTTSPNQTSQRNSANQGRRTKNNQRRKERNGNPNGRNPSPGDWLSCLRNPDISGGKVNDPYTLIKTASFQCQKDEILLANGHGVCGYMFDPLNLMTTNTSGTATAANVLWNTPLIIPGRNTNVSLFSQWRVVSAAIEFTYAGTTASDSGVAYGTCFPNADQTTFLYPGTSTDFSTQLNCEAYPVRNGMRVLWYPTDMVSATNFQTPKTTFADTNNVGILGFLAVGMASGAQLSIRVVTNLEALVTADSSSVISTSGSPSNPVNWNKAWEFVNATSNKVIPLFGGWSSAMNAAAQFASALNSNRVNRLLK